MITDKRAVDDVHDVVQLLRLGNESAAESLVSELFDRAGRDSESTWRREIAMRAALLVLAWREGFAAEIDRAAESLRLYLATT